jgi:hypothetical protein
MVVTKFDLVFEFFKATFWFSELMRYVPKHFEKADDIQTFTELHQQLERFAQRLLDLGKHYHWVAKPAKGRGKPVKQVKRNPIKRA